MTNQLDLTLAIDRVRPCPWCGAAAGDPCRADKGRGAELTKSVHPIRKKPSAWGETKEHQK